MLFLKFHLLGGMSFINQRYSKGGEAENGTFIEQLYIDGDNIFLTF